MPMTAVRPMQVRFPAGPLPDVTVDAELRFDTRHPYTARLSFPAGSNGGDEDPGVCWYFGRELLNEGRHGLVGNGDVQVRPGRSGEVIIALTGPTGTTVLSAPNDDVTAFLTESFELVPAGSESEHLDIDTTLRRILDED
ncbi:SsgA family sporulation/cell division regulator [Kitasatospora sp. NPDC054939]